VLVIEGSQGLGKSSAIKALTASDDWYADGVSGIGTKDAAEVLRGPWLVEVAELDAFSRAELATVKAFVSRRVDRFREAYGHRPKDYPRRCVFAATTNEREYLRDATGARRFWPVEATGVDLPGLRAARDQLWAEAVAAYRAGEKWYLDPEIATAAREQTDERYQADAWEEPIARYLVSNAETTVLEIAEHALKIDAARCGHSEQLRIAKALRRLGWEKSKNPQRRMGIRTRTWTKAAQSESSASGSPVPGTVPG
jgi:putative DNA primase/helicase